MESRTSGAAPSLISRRDVFVAAILVMQYGTLTVGRNNLACSQAWFARRVENYECAEIAACRAIETSSTPIKKSASK